MASGLGTLLLSVNRRSLPTGRVVIELKVGSEEGFLGGCVRATLSLNLVRSICPVGSGDPRRGCFLASEKGRLYRGHYWWGFDTCGAIL